MRISLFSGLLFSLFLFSGGCTPANEQNTEDVAIASDSVLFSFVFTGCNRVNRGDKHNHSATDGTTANIKVLKRIYMEIAAMDPKPELLFFLGDMVLGETDTSTLAHELKAWVQLYENPEFSQISRSGIEMVAVPGNHELLYYTHHGEYPLPGATDVWMHYMDPYLPADREHVSEDSMNNRATFAFKRHNTAFIVMNTDTYNENPDDPLGTEGMIPKDWIAGKAAEYQKDPSIDHIFVLGHKPCYVDGRFEQGHDGLPDGPELWPKLMNTGVNAMLSAHQHYYDRAQPYDSATYQVIAGNAGSSRYGDDTPPPFFGYTIIHVRANGTIELLSRGFDPASVYFETPPSGPTTTRDSTILTWTRNANPFSREENR